MVIECIQMGVCLLVDVKHLLGWYIFFIFVGGSRDLYPLSFLCNIKYV